MPPVHPPVPSMTPAPPSSEGEPHSTPLLSNVQITATPQSHLATVRFYDGLHNVDVLVPTLGATKHWKRRVREFLLFSITTIPSLSVISLTSVTSLSCVETTPFVTKFLQSWSRAPIVTNMGWSGSGSHKELTDTIR